MDALNDHEQAQLLKQWWQENGLALMLGLGLAIAAVLGWQFWQGYRDSQAATASAVYESLQDALAAKDMTAALRDADLLQTKYGSTPYASLGNLAFARELVEAKNYSDAAPRVRWAMDHADDDGLRAIARLRLARVLWANAQSEDALKLLDAKLPEEFAMLAAELRGDIYMGQGKRADARAAYEQALKAIPPATEEASNSAAGPGQENLRRKLADVQGSA